MLRIRKLAAALFVGVSFLIVGCADTATSPQPEAFEPAYGLLDDATELLESEQDVSVLRRTVPLSEDEVASQVIGPSGGVISLPLAGLTVSVPSRALRSDTRITVTAPAGDLVGYHFEPHGLQFEREVTVSQDLVRTERLGLSGLIAAYFEGELEPTVTALETLPLRLLRTLGIFQVEHFSGYVIATN